MGFVNRLPFETAFVVLVGPPRASERIAGNCATVRRNDPNLRARIAELQDDGKNSHFYNFSKGLRAFPSR